MFKRCTVNCRYETDDARYNCGRTVEGAGQEGNSKARSNSKPDGYVRSSTRKLRLPYLYAKHFSDEKMLIKLPKDYNEKCL